MGIGLPLVAALNVDEFRAVLAHEFAHYYAGDTSLGPVVYRTRQAMIRTIKNMASLSGAMRVWIAQIAYTMVMWILTGYWKLYLRASQFVSRRQEYRADELACRIAGAESLISGLSKIQGGAAAFPAYWNFEIAGFLNQGYRLPITEGFELFVKAPEVSQLIEKSVAKAIAEGKTGPYDSHPLLRDRIAAVRRLVDGKTPLGAPKPAASTLFDNLLDEEARLLSFSGSESRLAKLDVLPWNDVSRSVPKVWAQSVRANAHLLGDVRPENIPDLLPKLAEMGSRIPDPKGMLLTPEQRTGRAFELIGIALALAVANAGWPLHMSPGERYYDVNGERFSIREFLGNLSAKEITREEWVERCRTLKIYGIPLNPRDKAATSTQT